MSTHPKRVLIACGGTGGHLAPGIALAQTLRARGHTCQLLISQKQVDQRLIQKYPEFIFHALPAISLGRTHSQISPAALLSFSLSQIASVNFCAKIFRAFKPQAVVGFGGFSTVGAALCAATTRTPLILHEANHRTGRSIRTLAHLAKTIYLPPGAPAQGLPASKVRHLGLPLRQDLATTPQAQALQSLGFGQGGPLLVVLGGSQGSGPLNDWAKLHWPQLAQAGYQLLCVTGPGKGQKHEEVLHGQRALWIPFSDAMHLIYSAAHLIIARAGAGTIAELIRFRTPSILVPYPFAADHHQDANAQHLATQGGARVVDEKQLSHLWEATLGLLKAPTELESMRSQLAEIIQGDPALTMAHRIEELSHKKHAALEERLTRALQRHKIDTEAIKLSFNEPLGPKTTFGIGGPARVWAQPTNERELQTLLRLARRYDLPVFCLGRGSNLLVLDKGFDGLVIRLDHPHWQRIEPLKNGQLRAYSGVRLKVLCAEAAKRGMKGFEFMEGIPATLGGALHMNAGAFDAWTFDRVVRVRYLTAQGRVKESSPQRLRPGYRHVPGLAGHVVLWATLAGTTAQAQQEIKATMDSYQAKRKSSQPREASAGCVFKNPSAQLGAGRLIDEAGLKGIRQGGAMVSPIHANFIVNTGGATAKDVIDLINHIRQRVWEHKKVIIQPEIMLLGGAWNDYLIQPRDE